MVMTALSVQKVLHAVPGPVRLDTLSSTLRCFFGIQSCVTQALSRAVGLHHVLHRFRGAYFPEVQGVQRDSAHPGISHAHALITFTVTTIFGL